MKDGIGAMFAGEPVRECPMKWDWRGNVWALVELAEDVLTLGPGVVGDLHGQPACVVEAVREAAAESVTPQK